MKILIAEDDLFLRQLLQRTLENWGHEVVLAEDGQQAWDIFQQEKIKLIIADWMMPSMDGLTLCRLIRSSEGSGYVYFILLTGKDKKEDIIAGLDAGADDYVTKPFDREEVRGRLRAAERILNLERELTEKNLELIKLNNRLEELACIDPLTDIGNRRSFYMTIEKMHHRACRYDQSYSLIICDIDYFKAYNDTYGHLAGDQVLKTIAQTIATSLRTSDEVFRFGGEELIITLPDQDIKTTEIVAERIRKNIESLRIVHSGSPHGVVTISCGLTAFNMDCDISSPWDAIIERADRALYKAKEAGRNRIST